MSNAPTEPATSSSPSFLPKIGSPGYYVMLAIVAVTVLGPLGGVTAAYMNFSLGFFIGGQVLAGILGSIVTLGYGKEGKHGANYMQTMAASVSSMVWAARPTDTIAANEASRARAPSCHRGSVSNAWTPTSRRPSAGPCRAPSTTCCSMSSVDTKGEKRVNAAAVALFSSASSAVGTLN